MLFVKNLSRLIVNNYNFERIEGELKKEIQKKIEIGQITFKISHLILVILQTIYQKDIVTRNEVNNNIYGKWVLLKVNCIRRFKVDLKIFETLIY